MHFIPLVLLLFALYIWSLYGLPKPAWLQGVPSRENLGERRHQYNALLIYTEFVTRLKALNRRYNRRGRLSLAEKERRLYTLGRQDVMDAISNYRRRVMADFPDLFRLPDELYATHRWVHYAEQCMANLRLYNRDPDAQDGLFEVAIA